MSLFKIGNETYAELFLSVPECVMLDDSVDGSWTTFVPMQCYTVLSHLYNKVHTLEIAVEHNHSRQLTKVTSRQLTKVTYSVESFQLLQQSSLV